MNAPLKVDVVTSLAAIAPAHWDRLTEGDDPFIEHAFLLALEQSGSVGANTGWSPMHLVARNKQGEPVAALPLYLKQHSYGEYIFDWSWASAAARAGIEYYPKLVSMVPFTPTTGTRFLVAPEYTLRDVVNSLLSAAVALAQRIEASSIHLNFLNRSELDAVQKADPRFLPRLSMQFHWENAGYQNFDDFLQHFRAPLRKQVRKERNRVRQHGIEIRVVEGKDLSATDIDALRRFYMDTCYKRGSGPYLTPAFFDALQGPIAKRVVAVLAYRDSAAIAGTLNFERGRHLYGRYWGCMEELDALHFECCYYALIERAIDRGLTHFEAGAQGLHKLRRGLMPTEIYSAHYVLDPRLSQAVANFLPTEAFAVQQEMADLRNHGPFHRDP